MRRSFRGLRMALILTPCCAFAAYPIYEGKYEEMQDVQIQEGISININSSHRNEKPVEDFSVTATLEEFEEAMTLKKESLKEEEPVMGQECLTEGTAMTEKGPLDQEVVLFEQDSSADEMTSLKKAEPQNAESPPSFSDNNNPQNIANITPSRYKQSGAAARRSAGEKNNHDLGNDPASTGQAARKNSNRPQVTHCDPESHSAAQEQIEADAQSELSCTE